MEKQVEKISTSQLITLHQLLLHQPSACPTPNIEIIKWKRSQTSFKTELTGSQNEF
jgi:hypothetical protein